MSKTKTEILAVSDDLEHDPAIAKATELLKSGQLVAFPTETVYGLGGDATQKKAIDRIYKVKDRPKDNPMIVHVGEVEHMKELCKDFDNERFNLLQEHFWPGPLTMVLPATDWARKTVARKLETVAVRMPDHPVALALLRRAGIPVGAPSANTSGRPSPTDAAHVQSDLDGLIPLVLDGGPCRVGIESTVVDLTTPIPAILRPGSITVEQLSSVLGDDVIISGSRELKKRTPGSRYQHYCPDASVIVFDPEISDEAFKILEAALGNYGPPYLSLGYIGYRQDVDQDAFSQIRRFGKDNPGELAQNLYRYLREMDSLKVDVILIDGVCSEGIGISVTDRLRHAADCFFWSAGEVKSLAKDLKNIELETALKKYK